MSEIRRLLPRQFADWRGKYNSRESARALAGLSGHRHLLRRGRSRTDRYLRRRGRRSNGSSSPCISGVRSATPHLRKGETLRAGVQFVDLSDAERFYLDSLEEIKALW